MMKYTKISCLTTLLVFVLAGSLSAKSPFFEKFEFAPQLGTDFGAAVPFPIAEVQMGDMAISPSFYITPALRFAYKFDKRWAIGFDPAYKSVAISAKAQITNQKFNNGGTLAYFTGIADMDMAFSMFEFPLYCRFTLPNERNRFLLGYYAGLWTYKKFDNVARKGFISDAPDHVSSIVSGEGVNMIFTPYLRSFEHGVTLGYEHLFTSRFSGGVRFNLGLSDIFPTDVDYFDFSFLPIRVGFMASYTLF